MNDKIRPPTVFKSTVGENAVMAFYKSMLAQWPVKYETQELSTRHGNTFIIVCGEKDAEPLILLHGAGTNSTMWIGDIKAYSEHYRVYAIDIIGEAGKSSPNRPIWDGPAYEEWLTDIFSGLNLNRAAIIGISQGGWIALKFAIIKPERVNKLVLICPGGIIPDKMIFVFKVLPLMMLGSWGVKRIVKMLYGDQPIPDGVTEAMITMTKHFKPRVGTLPIFTDEALSQLTMPTLLIAGTKDQLRNSEAIAAKMQRLIKSFSVKLIQGGGHALNDTIDTAIPFLLSDTSSNNNSR